MKYMLMFVRDSDGWEETGRPAEVQATFARIGEWWAANSASGALQGGEQLQPARTATTVDPRSGEITDGPFQQARESIGGFGIVEASDLETVIAMARTWPAGNRVEIRPIVDQHGM